MASANELLRAAERELATAGVETPALEARVLLQNAMGWSRVELYFHLDDQISGDGRQRFDSILARRRAREPSAAPDISWERPCCLLGTSGTGQRPALHECTR